MRIRIRIHNRPLELIQDFKIKVKSKYTRLYFFVPFCFTWQQKLLKFACFCSFLPLDFSFFMAAQGGRPQARGQLNSPIRCNDGREAKARHPAMNEGLGYLVAAVEQKVIASSQCVVLSYDGE
jgi:hypothetical protein